MCILFPGPPRIEHVDPSQPSLSQVALHAGNDWIFLEQMRGYAYCVMIQKTL